MLALVLTSGCVGLTQETTSQRGPLLRTFERSAVHTSGGIQAAVQARWPSLTLSFTEFDLCRVEKVEEFAEDLTTVRSAPSFGPALALGASATLAGGGLLALRGLFSDQPNLTRIDGGGHYGAPPRQIATNWSVGLLAVGLPALAVAAIGHFSSGTDTRTQRVEEVASAVDTPCHHRPVDGRVQFLGQGTTPEGAKTQGGTVVLTATQLRGSDFDTVLLEGRAARAPAEDAARLSAFGACLEVLPSPGPEALRALALPALRELAASAEACGAVPEAPAAAAAAAIDAELRRRQAAPGTAPGFQSFDEAFAAAPRRVKLSAADLSALDRDVGPGVPVVLTGILLKRLDRASVVVEVGTRQVKVIADPERPWAVNLRPGSRVEVVGTLKPGRAGEAPWLEADWARTALQ